MNNTSQVHSRRKKLYGKKIDKTIEIDPVKIQIDMIRQAVSRAKDRPINDNDSQS